MEKTRSAIEGEPNGDKNCQPGYAEAISTIRNDDGEQSNVGHHPSSPSSTTHGLRRLSGLLSSSSNAHSSPLTRPIPAAAYTNPYLSPELSLSSPALLFASSSRSKSSVQSIQQQVAAMPPRTTITKDVPAFFPGMDEFYFASKKSVKSSDASTSGTSTKSGSSTKSPPRPKDKDGLSSTTKRSDASNNTIIENQDLIDPQGQPRVPPPVPSEPTQEKVSSRNSAPLGSSKQVEEELAELGPGGAATTTTYASTGNTAGNTLASSSPSNLPILSPPGTASSSPPHRLSTLPSTSSPPTRRLALSTSPRDYASMSSHLARGTPPSTQTRTILKKRAASAGSSSGPAVTGIAGGELEATVDTTISRNQQQGCLTNISATAPSRPFRRKNNTRHHTLPQKVAPYPRSYDTRAIDQDTTDHIFLTSLCRSVTWHDFAQTPPNQSISTTNIPADMRAEVGQSGVENAQRATLKPPLMTPTFLDKPPELTPPTPVPDSTPHKAPAPRSVLDIGCGNGVWIMDCAKVWPEARFVGLDLVPIQPNLSVVDPKLEARVEWINANFLQRLPFPDSHFDYVHIRRIARGVPEDKWPDLLEEVSRVLEPNGALEILEEDLIFPGGSEPCTCHYPPDWTGEDEEVRNEETRSSEHSHHNPEKDLHHTGYQGLFYPSQAVDVHDHSHLEQAYNDMHADRFINLRPISVLTNILPLYFRDVRSHPPLLLTFPPPEAEMWSDVSSLSSSSGESDASGVIHDNDGPVTTPRRQTTTIPTSPHMSRPSTANSSAIYSIDSSAVESSHGGSPPRGRSPPQQQNLPLPLDVQVETVTGSPASPEYMQRPPPGGWHTLHIDVRSLVHPKQPFIMIDRCRMPARVASAGGDNQSVAEQMMTRLPNLTFEFDFQHLTMCLAHSVSEVLECKEEIWEYMVKKGEAKPCNGSNSATWIGLGMSLATSTGKEWCSDEGAPKAKKPIRSRSPRRDEPIERKDFDLWVSNYEHEMNRRIQLAKTMRSRLDWKPRELVSSEFHSPNSHHSTANSISGPGSKQLSPITPGAWSSTFAPFSAISTEPSSRRADPNCQPPSSSQEDVNGGTNPQGDDSDERQRRNPMAEAYSSSTSLLGNESSNADVRKRVNSVPEKLQRRRGSGHSSQQGHARTHSLDAADAWETLVQESAHLAGLRGDDGAIAGGTTDKSSKAVNEHPFQDDVPRLSRCVKVFVAWNNKT